MHTIEDSILLHKYILDEIGISIENGALVDQDTSQRINFNGNPLVYSFNIENPVFDTEDSTKLDMINNIKISNMMFGYYIEKEKLLGNIISVSSFYQVDSNDDTGRSALGIKIDLGEGLIDIYSDFFYNNSLKYPDMILKLANINYDVHIFDDPLLVKTKKKK